jgi:DNA-binding CsgD family transcriptional regulator/GAF domain-containing protein
LAHRRIEAELAAALMEGFSESPLWSGFMRQLRRATAADNCAMVVQSPSRPLEEALRLHCGDAPAAASDQFFRKHYRLHEPLETSPTIEARPYTLAELFNLPGARETPLYRTLAAMPAIAATRFMRVQEPTGIGALLSITRQGKDFTARDTALLRAIAPALRSALKLYVARERERFAASLNAEAVRRLQFGWLTLDRAGMVLETDEQAARVLADSRVLSQGDSGRIGARPARLERALLQALGRMANDPKSRPRAITLSREPWLDMLLVPARTRSMSAQAAPAAIAYVHGDSWSSADRCEQLAELFALSPGEARLALALSRGMTIAEAAAEFGLATGTARNYSKTIYAKTGARGLPDLVRIVMRSVLAIAPDN